MGADFISATLPVFAATEERLTELRKMVEDFDYAGQRYGVPADGLDSDEKKDVDDTRDLALAALESYSFLDERSDCGLLSVSDYGAWCDLWLTGGESYGDTPTDLTEQWFALPPTVLERMAAFAKADSGR